MLEHNYDSIINYFINLIRKIRNTRFHTTVGAFMQPKMCRTIESIIRYFLKCRTIGCITTRHVEFTDIRLRSSGCGNGMIASL
jgi:hypothetical protein